MGGGIFNGFTVVPLTLTNTIVSGNSANQGGGINNWSDGELVINGGIISGNHSATTGGGINNVHRSDLVINDAVVCGNYTDGSGGGIYSDSDSTLEINTTIVALNGAGLDGDDIEGVWTGSNNQIGADQVDMDVLIHDVLGTEYGDANLDGAITLADMTILATNFGITSGATWSQGDFNGDGAVTLADMTILSTNYGFPWAPGDANKDGKVGLADLTIVSTNFGITEGATWSQGDFNGDGAVSLADMTILASNFGFDGTAAPAGSSEPVTASLEAEPEQATVALTEPVASEPVAPAVAEPETTSPVHPTAMAGYWQSQRSQRHNSQRSALQLLSSRQQNQWLNNDSADDEIDLLMVPALQVM